MLITIAALFLSTIHIVCGEDPEGKSLTIVFDTTGSMGDDLEQVRNLKIGFNLKLLSRQKQDSNFRHFYTFFSSLA